MAVKEISLDALSAPVQTQPRVEIDEDLVEEYAELIARGVALPPIDAFNFGNNQYIVVDGFHRVLAHEKAGLDKIRCTIHKGSLRDATWFSYAANQAHGKRRTSEDKKKAILSALRHKNGAKMSDNKLAEYLGVSQPTVGKYRHELETTYKNFKSTKRTGKDGRTTNTANIGRKVKAKTPVQEPVVDAEDEKPAARTVKPPSDGMKFARLAVMDLEQIRSDDSDRMAAFEFVSKWVSKHEGQNTRKALPPDRLEDAIAVLGELKLLLKSASHLSAGEEIMQRIGKLQKILEAT